MQMLNFTRAIPAALAAVLLFVPPALARTTGIKAIDVTAELDAFRAAPDQSTVLPERLKQAIAVRLANQLAANGRDIRVKISSDVLPKGDGEPNGQAKLSGVVSVMEPSPTGPTVRKVYRLTVTSQQLESASANPNEIIMTPDRTGYQNALVNSFADYVVQHL